MEYESNRITLEQAIDFHLKESQQALNEKDKNYNRQLATWLQELKFCRDKYL